MTYYSLSRDGIISIGDDGQGDNCHPLKTWIKFLIVVFSQNELVKIRVWFSLFFNTITCKNV